VRQAAEPVVKQAADLAAHAVTAAELTPAQLTGVYLIGGAAATPAAARVVGEVLGVQAQPVTQPEFAAVLGAADAGAAATTPAASGARPVVPPLRRLYGILVPGVSSLLLYGHMLATAEFRNGSPSSGFRDPYYYVIATWGELATAALFALIACLAAGCLFGTALHQMRPPQPGRSPAGAGQGISDGIWLAVAAGMAVAALYAIAAALYFAVPLSGPLRWALLPILPTAVVAAGLGWLIRGRQHPPQGWDAVLAFPISSILCAAAGTLILATWWSQLLVDADIVGRAGGVLIGVAMALALVRHPGLRAGLAVFLGFFGFLAVGSRATGILAVIYAITATLWWAQRLWIVTRTSRAGR
jgi:hypothetical protein